ncbi:hypothetical protein ELH51_27280 [Rhizobium ruizarguesonis]|uniref:hypothetical protein n=1 Tax=Rhizobium ruizarguesonis TaxID=2081791 RepID=UPI0010311A88|nr:hypothetical protein [Rhizobium ruizarguesonis]TBB25186.1 hypothetical protein ELH51_27280 [Rhizobium ruizarguesonis]
MSKRLLLITALALSGCQSGADHQAQIDAMLDGRLSQYNGRPISEFMSATGMTPQDAYPVSDGRVFVFRTAPVYMTLPATNVTPAIMGTAQCQLLVRTTNEIRASGADAWIISGTERSGACNNLPL